MAVIMRYEECMKKLSKNPPYLEPSVFGKVLMGSLLDIDIDLGIRRRITELESCYASLGKLCLRKGLEPKM